MYVFTPETENLTVQLKNGRKIGYATYGNPEGYPIIYFHGFPGSRFEGKMFDRDMESTPFKIIALDRPGIGLSSPQKDRTILSWAEDVLEFADILEIKRFAVMGISGGGPYALACAYHMPPERLVCVMVVSGMGPAKCAMKHMGFIIKLGFRITRFSKGLFRLISRAMFYSQFKTVDRAVKNTRKMINDFSAEDKAIFEENSPDLEQFFVADNYYGYIQGEVGTTQDVELYARPWGFQLSDIPVNLPVFLQHGEADDLIPVAIGRYVASQIPNCDAEFFPDGGHFSTAYRYVGKLMPKILPLFEATKVE